METQIDEMGKEKENALENFDKRKEAEIDEITKAARKIICESISQLLEDDSVAEIIKFGEYQNEKIEWRILAKENNKLLVISKYALDRQPYHTTRTDITWESCSLRSWLNNEFLNEAFSETEQSMIAITTIKNAKNLEYGTPGGANTHDKVFILSIAEVEKYFSSDSYRQAEPTAYGVAQGEYVNDDDGNYSWWLRSPGRSRSHVAYVYSGNVFDDGVIANNDDVAIRPAMWINLED